MTDTKISHGDATSLADKLKSFSETLSTGEQDALALLLTGFQDRLDDLPDGALADFPDAEELLSEVAGYNLSPELNAAPAATPTITTVTITTVAASHPTIGCHSEVMQMEN